MMSGRGLTRKAPHGQGSFTHLRRSGSEGILNSVSSEFEWGNNRVVIEEQGQTQSQSVINFTVVSGPDLGKQRRFDQDRITIGRDIHNDFMLSDGFVSN